MLKVEKKNGLWQACLVGRPSKDLITAMRSLVEVTRFSDRLDRIIGSDVCLGRDCDGCDIAGCDPVASAESFAAQVEIEFPQACGFSIEDVETWDEPVKRRDP